MAKYKCVFFKAVNGKNTGVYTRTGQSKSKPSPGILFMRNCPDGKTFYVDADAAEKNNDPGENGYWKLLEPEKYKLGAYDKNKHTNVWMWINPAYISMEKIEDTPPKPAPAPAPKPATTKDYSIKGITVKEQNLIIDTSKTKKGPKFGEDTTFNIPKTPNTTNSTMISSNHSSLNPAKQRADTVFIKNLNSDLLTIEKNLNIAMSMNEVENVRKNMITKFNRFKIAYPDLALSKSFAHIFFTRPNLNIYKSPNVLQPKLESDATFYYLHKNNPTLLKSLTSSFDSRHDFNPFLSNVAESFELSDEYIDTMEYGETLTGYKIKYGKNNIKSKTAGTISIMFTDDNQYRVYKIHKAWVDYISKVYRGEINAARENILNRVLDYAASIYYIVCGPDGETILFWSKYTGVFPTVIPSAASAWSKGKLMSNPEFSISYDYAWKEDFNPLSLAEFNINGNKQNSYIYAKTYEDTVLGTGRTFMEAPFVESISTASGYEFKLKFRTRYS